MRPWTWGLGRRIPVPTWCHHNDHLKDSEGLWSTKIGMSMCLQNQCHQCGENPFETIKCLDSPTQAYEENSANSPVRFNIKLATLGPISQIFIRVTAQSWWSSTVCSPIDFWSLCISIDWINNENTLLQIFTLIPMPPKYSVFRLQHRNWSCLQPPWFLRITRWFFYWSDVFVCNFLSTWKTSCFFLLSFPIHGLNPAEYCWPWHPYILSSEIRRWDHSHHLLDGI